ncbi:hypothetical protein [Umezawaea sp. Da 62-37]|uniref:hypothetical protein n=1 Tax=Umezawaea sp. Da 62-37 TaxID=3075927 RepID=UPI0028F6EF38|nr:hypothetical protein [Umezawaea sp. Da 62-37]WNV83069.1 hypothetical protein RM788_33425 [Umezawaea sp. Da 62-37]
MATYELGTRRIAVDRLIEVCAALEVPADELLLRAMIRAFGIEQADHLQVDLVVLAGTEDPQLCNLRPWAAVALDQHCGSPIVGELDHPALTPLAAFARITTDSLQHALLNLRTCAPRDLSTDAARDTAPDCSGARLRQPTLVPVSDLPFDESDLSHA